LEREPRDERLRELAERERELPREEDLDAMRVLMSR
jgi:hypothetical protein